MEKIMMKIRTDFVTNSSSVSLAEVVIDNPILLEILQRYKEMGVFGETESSFAIGLYEANADGFDSKNYEMDTKTPAFFVFESHGGEGWSTVDNTPKSLDEVVENIIYVMNHRENEPKNYIQTLYEAMKVELQNRAEEIKEGYLKIKWSFLDESGETVNPDENKWVFTYDPENGEKYSVSYFKGEAEDEEWDEEEEDSDDEDDNEASLN
jgi:hypothetical protein